MSLSLSGRHAGLVLTVVGMVAGVFALAPIPQGSAAHLMVDGRPFFGIPNGFDVLSNIPFAAVGLLGLATTFATHASRSSPFSDRWERWPYAVLFANVALVAVGSSYYHLAPDNARLVWDRLPMSIAFVALLAALLAERVSVPLSRRLFVPLLVAGAASVPYWYWTEIRNAGDLRPYILVQFGSLVVIVLLLVLYPARHRGTRYLVAGLGAYAIAKGFELSDGPIFAFGGIASGHTLKHLAAAAGVACLVVMLRVRTRPVGVRPAVQPGSAASRRRGTEPPERSRPLSSSPV